MESISFFHYYYAQGLNLRKYENNGVAELEMPSYTKRTVEPVLRSRISLNTTSVLAQEKIMPRMILPLR
jgi:hypothetical protein